MIIFVFLTKICVDVLISSDEANVTHDGSWLISQVNLLGNTVILPKFVRNYKTCHLILYIKFHSYFSNGLNLDLNFLLNTLLGNQVFKKEILKARKIIWHFKVSIKVLQNHLSAKGTILM